VLERVASLFAMPFVLAVLYRAVARARIEVRPDQSGAQVLCDDVPRWPISDAASLVPTLEWAIANLAMERVGRQIPLLHAGAVALNGRGLLIPGVSGAGKSTLVAALAASGFSYLADDMTVVDPKSACLLTFGRAIGLKHGSLAPLAPYYPDLERTGAGLRFGNVPMWYVVPPSDAWYTRPVPLHAVILPRFQPGTNTILEPLARSDGLAAVLPQLFQGREVDAGVVGRIVALLQQAACYRLTFGDLPSAVDAIRTVLSA
jgi:hypothetical protein